MITFTRYSSVRKVKKKRKVTYLDFEIDKLTNSIENSISGDKFETDIIEVLSSDEGIKKAKWKFDWRRECKEANRKVYKLVIRGSDGVIQGLISLSDNKDHVFIHLIESAKFNRGGGKLYIGVAGNLVAFACKQSVEYGYQGFVTFYAKTQLIGHYQKTLNAISIGGLQMIIDSRGAGILINKYFKL